MSKPLAWVNVNDPKKFKDAEQQRLIQQHVGKNFRNRSKPMQRLQQEREQQRLEQQSDKHRDAASPKQFAPGYSSPSLTSDFSGSLTHKLHREHVELRRLNDNQNSSGTVRLSASKRMHTGPPSPPPPPPSPQERLLALVPDPNEVEDEVNGNEDFKDAWAYGVLTYLDQSRADPLATYPVDGSDRHISLLVDYAVQNFWSILSPNEIYGAANPVNNVYLMHMRSSPLAYFTYSVSISTNFDYVMDGNPLRKKYQSLRARHIHAATQLVRKAIQEMPDNPSAEHVTDELIGSVITLSANHRINVVNRKNWPTSQFRSPLAGAQCLDMWGALPFIRPHRLAVVQLVNMRGGLDKLGLTMAGVVLLNDMIDCSQNCIPPMVPWRDCSVPLAPLSWPWTSTEDYCVDNDLTKAFSVLSPDILHHRNLDLTISAIAHTTETLNLYHLKGRPVSLIAHLVQSRNRAHYLTLSLQTRDTQSSNDSKVKNALEQEALSSSSQNSYVFEVIRLSLLIYNNLVIFPLPLSIGLDSRLARTLKHTLCSALSLNPSLPHQYTELLLWSVVLGGIGDHKGTDRVWYERQCKELLDLRPDIRKWHNLERLLTSFLWSDFVLNEEAVKFWSKLFAFDGGFDGSTDDEKRTDTTMSTPSCLETPGSIN